MWSLRAPTEPLGSGLADRPAAVRTADDLNGTIRQLGVPYFGVLIIRILLFRALY